MQIIKKYMRRQKGFMLTEVLITALLIVITMVGVVPILFSGMKAVKVSKSRAIGMNYVQKEIESFNNDQFTNVLSYVEKKINDPVKFTKFKDDESGYTGNGGDNGAYKEFLSDFYINTINGSTSDTLKPGYKRATLSRTYTFIKGEDTITDDAIQLYAALDMNGEQTLKMTAVLSRDKLK